MMLMIENLNAKDLHRPSFFENYKTDIMKEQALAKSIVKEGLVNPLFAYKCEGKLWLLDGYHRRAAIQMIYASFGPKLSASENSDSILSWEEVIYPNIPRVLWMPLSHEDAKLWRQKVYGL